MREKNFSDMRKWVATNGDSDTSLIFRTLYEASSSFLEPSSVPQLIILLADYQYKAAFVADHEINLMACLTEIAASCKFV
jgi:replication factor C small subunit